MLYTGKGDKGTSELFGTQGRLPKNHPVYEALGTVDELNSLLGWGRAQAGLVKSEINIAPVILGVQEGLFIIQAEIAGTNKSISGEQVKEVEHLIDQIEAVIPNPHAFVIPGATEFSAWCDFARAVARRAERTVLAVAEERNLSPASLAYLNRLSSLLYALARYSATIAEVEEAKPAY